MPRKEYPPAQHTAMLEDAEALGILWAASIGKTYTPTGVAPDVYGPGRQPVPKESYYQKYWQAPQDAVTADPPRGIPADLPDRIEADAFVIAQHGKQVDLVSKVKHVVLNFGTLV
jgi:hypothetical protein